MIYMLMRMIPWILCLCLFLCKIYVDICKCECIVLSLSWITVMPLASWYLIDLFVFPLFLFRISLSGPWGSCCTCPAPRQTRPFPPNCASRHCQTHPPPRVGALPTPAEEVEWAWGSPPSLRAGRPYTPSRGRWSPAGTLRPWAGPTATPTPTNWPPREARTAMASAGLLAHGCQTSTIWKRQLFKRQSHYHTLPTVTPVVLDDHDSTIDCLWATGGIGKYSVHAGNWWI